MRKRGRKELLARQAIRHCLLFQGGDTGWSRVLPAPLDSQGWFLILFQCVTGHVTGSELYFSHVEKDLFKMRLWLSLSFHELWTNFSQMMVNWGPTTQNLFQTQNTSMKSKAMLNFWLIVASTKANEILGKHSSVFPIGFLSIRGEDEVCLSVNP